MKSLMLALTFLILAPCSNLFAAERDYTDFEEQALLCNENALGWAQRTLPRTAKAAERSMARNPHFRECGLFGLYVEAVIDENPEATYLIELLTEEEREEMGRPVSEDDEDEDEGETYYQHEGTGTRAQIAAWNCTEEILEFSAYPPTTLADARAKLAQAPQYKACGHFDFYVKDVVVQHPTKTFLLTLINQ